jgi:hypothetical protein
LSRHRKIQFSRSKAILVAAGALSIATVASATTTTWTTGSAGPVSLSGHAEATGRIAVRAPGDNGVLQLAVADQLTPPQADVAYQLTGVTFGRAYKIRAAAAQYAAAQRSAAQQQLAKNAAAARAAAARAAAARAAAARAAAVLAPAAATAATATAATTAAAGQSPALSASPRPRATATAPARSASPRPKTAPARSGSPQQIAEAMLGSFGWSSSQFACLDPLWARESGWSVTAENPSGAYGIPQALPGSKMASAGADWQTSAATQIEWGLGYIKGIYGSPCAAWDHEQATGWY